MDVDDTHLRATPSDDDLGETHKRPTPMVGSVISGRYRLEAMLAAGGMGEVYRAVHVELGRPFALKLMRPELSQDPTFVERFRREAMTASRLGHPNIVDIVDSGRAESGQFFFVMEFLDGKTLSSLLDGGALDFALALELTTQIARALEVAHRAGVVHRDLKPDNLIVLQRAGQPVVKIVDFGIAKIVTPAPELKQTTHGVVMGTPQYMAPEQAAGVALDQRADVYALGLILFELLTGTPPLTGATAALVMSAHIATPAPPLPAEFPAPLRELVARMLAKRPGERPASMTEVLQELERVPRTLRRPAKAKLLALGVGVAAVLTGAALAFGVGAPPPSPASAAVAPAVPVIDAGVAQVALVVDAGPAAREDAGVTPPEKPAAPPPSVPKKSPTPRKPQLKAYEE